jgi:hypothetical protein
LPAHHALFPPPNKNTFVFTGASTEAAGSVVRCARRRPVQPGLGASPPATRFPVHSPERPFGSSGASRPPCGRYASAPLLDRFFSRSTVASACNDRAPLPQPARPRGLQCGFGVAEGEGGCYGVLAWFDLAVLVGKVVRLASASRPQRCGSATATSCVLVQGSK